jgi:cell division protease FtsH
MIVASAASAGSAVAAAAVASQRRPLGLGLSLGRVRRRTAAVAAAQAVRAPLPAKRQQQQQHGARRGLVLAPAAAASSPPPADDDGGAAAPSSSSPSRSWLAHAARLMGATAVVLAVGGAAAGRAHAATPAPLPGTATCASAAAAHNDRACSHARASSSGRRAPAFGDLAATAVAPSDQQQYHHQQQRQQQRRAALGAAVADALAADPALRQLVAERQAAWYAAHPSVDRSQRPLEQHLAAALGQGGAAAAGGAAGAPSPSSPATSLGLPLDLDDVLRSSVYSPSDVPGRLSKEDARALLRAMLDQYDDEDFDLAIKQFMVEQQVKAQMEDQLDKQGGGKDFEETLAAKLFADDKGPRMPAPRPSEIEEDAFTTEVAEEALLLMGPSTAATRQTAWRNADNLAELAYSQLWQLVSEGSVERVRMYGPDKMACIVWLKDSAPGGARACKCVLAPDPAFLEHLSAHAVRCDPGTEGWWWDASSPAGQGEAARVRRAMLAQAGRYAFPFIFLSWIFWVLHTYVLDPIPNRFRRREFVRYRREILHVGTRLNFRSPARQVDIDTTAPDFIRWDDINGIDEVKREISEIIDYLKNPALLRLRGVSRIGGVLLAGAPGTGKTLLAKAIAAESGVRMFTCSGTDFYDVFTGVGARRVRETFDLLRNYAPAILFVDEFDALGASRGSGSSGGGNGNEEGASIINELLVQMDGFEDNRGIVVLGATNRPGAIDAALIRPGRFDRVVYMPLPDAAGRAAILQVHARNKRVVPGINWLEVARSMAGFTGADCMGLMGRAARMAGRAGREAVTEEDIYAALEDKVIEAKREVAGNEPPPGIAPGPPNPIPARLRRSVAAYEAGKVLVAYCTPEFEDVARVSVCPHGTTTGYTLFVDDEEKHAGCLLTRGDMEARMVVRVAGRCAEKLVMGEGELTGLGAMDVYHANSIAREMVMASGMSRRIGPVEMMHLAQGAQQRGDMLAGAGGAGGDDDDELGSMGAWYHASEASTEQIRAAQGEVVDLLEAAEAKAYYCLAVNWPALRALSDALLESGTLDGRSVERVLEGAGVVRFPDPYLAGFGWGAEGQLLYPFRPTDEVERDVAEGKVAAETKGEAEGGEYLSDGRRLPGALFPRAADFDVAPPDPNKSGLPQWYIDETAKFARG